MPLKKENLKMLSCRSILLGSVIILCVTFSLAQGEKSEHSIEKNVYSPSPIVYPLKIIYLFETGKTEFIISAGNVGFKSVAALKEWVAKLPPRTTLELDMMCRHLGNEPLVSSEEELNDFKKFCEEHKIILKIRPAG